MDKEEYRIVQTADAVFVVEKLHHYTVRGRWPWSARVPRSKWVGVGLPRYPYPFPTQAAALKWVCDKHIYPRVVKELHKELP